MAEAEAPRARIGMGCRDVVLSSVLGVVLVAFTALGGSGASNPLGQLVAQVAFGLWWVGVASTAGAVLLRVAKRWPMAQAILGYLGIAWMTYVAVSVGLLLVYLTISPIGM